MFGFIFFSCGFVGMMAPFFAVCLDVGQLVWADEFSMWTAKIDYWLSKLF